MGKYLLIWELEKDKIPIDPKERREGFDLLMALIKQDMEKGLIKDWGAFAGETNGYCVVEGSEVELGNFIHQYVPYAFFKATAVATYPQVTEIVAALKQ